MNDQSRRRTAWAAFGLAVSFVGTGAPAGAQEASHVEEIVVTAQKRAQSINDVSIAVAAFDGEDLDAMGITDTRDLAMLVPGFTYADSGFNSPIYTLRGVGFNEASQTASPTVGIYLDEVNLPFPVMSKGANLDLERVEVLKGPQGTLYGRNTTGGAVNYIARKPTDELDARFSLGYANYGTLDAEAAVGGPILDGLRARVAIRTVNSDEGWQYSLTRPGDRLGKKDKQTGRASLEWNALESLTIRATVDAWRDHSEPQAPQAVALRAQNPILGDLALSNETIAHPLVSAETDDARVADWPANPPLGRDYRLHDGFIMGTLRGDWTITDWAALTVLGSLARFESDGSALPQSGLSVEYVTDRIIDVDSEAESIEARLAGTWGENVNWLAGAFFGRDEVSELQDYFVDEVSAVFPEPGGTPISDRIELIGSQEAETLAGFANVEWQFLSALKLTLGARYTDEKRTFTGCSKDSVGRTQGVGFGTIFNVLSLSQGGTGGANPANGDCFTIDQETHNPALSRPDPLEEDNLSWRMALDWRPVDWSLLYFSYSRGFKSGSFPVLSSSRSDQYEPVTQEQLDAYEVGAKTTLLDGAAQLNVAGFYYDYTDKQLLTHLNDPVFGPLPVLANAPESRVYGAELDAQWRPLDGLFLSGGLAWIDTEILELMSINNDGDPEDYSGDPFNFAPEWSWVLRAQYEHPLSELFRARAGADYSFTDETNSQLGQDPRFAHDDYGLLDARVAVLTADDRWELTLWGKNLTDEYYVVGVFNPGDTIGRFTGMPRTYGFTASYRF